ncbi:MAG TPA: BrxA/BrxB family bacilliredoxin [Bryobacterales bacterium]|nr:BrxA/BrxB family bacilliredoxin [Bryobacterales bacterium]
MQYPEHFIAPMRAELSSRGVVEARTPEQVDELLAPGGGTVLMVVNSVCGCAAGSARPGVLKSLESDVRPDKVATVFAGGDVEALAHVRQILSPLPPSSPSAALFSDGKPVYMLHRYEIEGRDPSQIAEILKKAYADHCVPQPQA